LHGVLGKGERQRGLDASAAEVADLGIGVLGVVIEDGRLDGIISGENARAGREA
jgi:hypothetical protein